jgi:hypothetical protein
MTRQPAHTRVTFFADPENASSKSCSIECHERRSADSLGAVSFILELAGQAAHAGTVSTAVPEMTGPRPSARNQTSQTQLDPPGTRVTPVTLPPASTASPP